MTTRESTGSDVREDPDDAPEVIPETPEERYPKGTYAHDAKARRSGLVVGYIAGKVALRPVVGGIEWDAEPDSLTRVEASEALRPEIRRINGGTR